MALQPGGVTVDRVVGLNLPGKHNVVLLGGHLEGLVMPLPAKEAGQDLNEAGVGPHEVVIDQTRPMHAHLHTTDRHSWYSRNILGTVHMT